MRKIVVHKLDHQGQAVWQYEGDVLDRSASHIRLEAYFNRDDVVLDYHSFRRGDLMIEWFYTDRWYNVFEMYDVESGQLKGWYCNITRPARFEDEALYSEDLALDLMVYPDGRYLVLDEDDFEALPLDDSTYQQAQAALQSLIAQVAGRQEMFAKITPDQDSA